MEKQKNPFVRWLHQVDSTDIAEVGGKNASLGEIVQHLSSAGINCPSGFAITSNAYYNYLYVNELKQSIGEYLEQYTKGEISVEEAGRAIRKSINNGIFPIPIAESIRAAYAQLGKEYNTNNVDVAVRSSATAEDLPSASFAGLQESYLNIRGEEELLKACRKCFASLFTARAIVYREEKGIDHFGVGLSIGVQKMIRSDNASSGVIFTLDTESGFPNLIIINGAWGLGENVVREIVNPDQFLIFKPLIGQKGVTPIIEKKLGSKELKMVYASGDDRRVQDIRTTTEERNSFVLTDEEVLTLACWAKAIEDHYGHPMDIEWVKDDRTKDLYVVQARPETVYSSVGKDAKFTNYRLSENNAQVLLTGLSVGNSIVSGRIKKINNADDLAGITSDTIVLTQMTDPDWLPSMKNVAGIITDSGGLTSHAATISRELGIPAIVGTHYGTTVFNDGQEVTMSCAEGEEGKIYSGQLQFEIEEVNLGDLPNLKTDVMVNMTVSESPFKWWRLPVKGVGLARMESILTHHIKAHPMALINFDRIISEKEREQIRKLAHNYKDKRTFFVEELTYAIAKIAASQYPDPVILSTSGFKTDEYASLIGGETFEPDEANPTIGWRGACRYYNERYREGFVLECLAIKKVRDEIGLDNLVVMIPFCRTTEEAKAVLEIMSANGLKRGENGLKIFLMCQIPSNVILADEFARYFDGFSIDSDVLTQLVLGVDRDSTDLSHLFDGNNGAVKRAIAEIIAKAHQSRVKVNFCGQITADDSSYVDFLVEAGIDSISITPDRVINLIHTVYQAEKEFKPANI